MKKFLPYVAISIIVAVLFFPVLFQEKYPVPADSIAALYHPYRDFFIEEFPQGYPFKNFLITDPLRQQYSWREISVDAFRSFKLPLWNPYNGTGEPLLANIQAGALYPLNLLFFVFPFQISWSILIMLQPLLAGIFLYLYLVNLKLSPKASLIGSIAFAFSGFNTTWLEWGTIVHTGLWLPIILLSIDKLILCTDRKASSIKDKSMWFWGIILVFSFSSSLFAGHLQTFFYLFVFAQIYFLARWITKGKNKKMFITYIMLNTFFLILTSVQWIPTLILILNSARGIDQLWQKEGWFLPFEHLVQFVAPDFFGNPSTQNYWGTWNYGELTGYIGLLPLLLAFVAIFCRRDKKTLFFGGAVLVSFIMAIPNFISKIPFVYQIPFISTAQPTRLIFVIGFSLSVLAALGFDYFEKRKKSVFLPFLFLFIIFIFLWIIALGGLSYFDISQESLNIIKSNLRLPSLLLLASVVLVGSYSLFTKNKKIIALVYVGLFLLISFDLLRFSSKFNSFSEKRLLFPETKTVKFLQEKSRDYPWRFLAVDYVENQKRIFAPNLSSHHGLYTLDTYNPLILRRYQEFAAVSEWGFTDIPDFSFNRSIMLNNYESPLIDFMGVKYIASIIDIDSESLKFLFSEGETRVYENLEVYDRAFMVYDFVVLSDKKELAKKIYDPTTNLGITAVVEEALPVGIENVGETMSAVEIVDYQSEKIEITVDTKNAGMLVLTDAYYPTWKVFVDGQEKKIYRVDYNFRGVIVPSGKHKVIFRNSLL